MHKEILKLESIATREISIINRAPVNASDAMQLEVNRKTKNSEEHFHCLLTALIYREDEKDEVNRSFSLRFVIEGTFESLEEFDKEKASDAAMEILFPFLRAEISSVLAASFIDTIILPPFITTD